jgi:signal transduction histidine kinase
MDAQSKVTLFIALGSVAMVIMFIAIVTITYFYQRKILKNKLMSQRLLEREVFAAAIVAEERQKEAIANNLHDTVNSNLTLVRDIIHLQNKERLTIKNGAPSKPFINCEQIIEECISGIRAACYDLKPQLLHNLGLVKAMEHILYSINLTKSARCTFTFENSGHFSEEILQAKQINIYRIVQELLNNVLKHAKPSYVDFIIHFDRSAFIVLIFHDGSGIDTKALPELKRKGLGLSSIESRRMVLKGEINYSSDGNKNSISLCIPL